MVGRLGTQGLFLGVISEIYLGGDYVFDGFFRATNSTKVRCKPVWVGRIYRGEGCAGQGSVWRRRATSGAGRLGRGAKVGRLAERRGLHADAWACGLPKAQASAWSPRLSASRPTFAPRPSLPAPLVARRLQTLPCPAHPSPRYIRPTQTGLQRTFVEFVARKKPSKT